MSGLCQDIMWGSKGGHRDRREQAVPPFLAERGMTMNEFDEKARTWDADPAKVERAQRVAEAIRGQIGSLADREVLEYGCGTGLLGFALQPHVAHLTLADTSQGMLQVLEEKIAACGARNVTSLALDLSVGPLPELRFEHRTRPRCRVRLALDRLDEIEVAGLEPPELDVHALKTGASGART